MASVRLGFHLESSTLAVVAVDRLIQIPWLQAIKRVAVNFLKNFLYSTVHFQLRSWIYSHDTMISRIRMRIKRKETAGNKQMPIVSASSIARKVNEQDNSTLFRNLPLELRILIYRQVLLDFGDSLHISLNEKKQIKHSRCVGERPSYLSRDLQRYWGPWGCNHSWCQQLSVRDYATGIQGSPVVALLQTCRAVYVGHFPFSIGSYINAKN